MKNLIDNVSNSNNANLRLLNVFYDVVRSGSFTKAAVTEVRTHSAVSQDIKALENLLQMQLFTRHKQGVTLTKHGEELFAKIGQPISAIADVFTKNSQTQKNSIIIGAGLNITQFVLAKYPYILDVANIKFVDDITDRLFSKLETGEIDVVITSKQITNNKFDSRDLLTQRFVLIANKNADTKNIWSLPFIMHSETTNNGAKINAFFATNNIRPNIALTVDRIPTIISMVKNNNMIAIVPEISIFKEPDIVALPIDLNMPTSKYKIYWNKQYPQKLVMQLVKKLTI